MPPPQHRRRSPHRKGRRSFSQSRSRSGSRSRGGFRQKVFPKKKFSPKRCSRSRSRSVGKYSDSQGRKFDKFSKVGRRSPSPYNKSPGRRDDYKQRFGTPPRRKSGQRSPSDVSQSYSRSPSPSTSKMPQTKSPGERGFADKKGSRCGYKKDSELPVDKLYSRKQSTELSPRKRNDSFESGLKKPYRGSSVKESSPFPVVEQRKLLNDRFKCSDVPPVEVEENITIGIHRKLGPRKQVSNIVIRDFNAMTDFRLLRRSDEGSQPLFDREEIRQFGWDDRLEDEITPFEERRVITVATSTKLDTEPVSPVFQRTAKPGSYVSRFGSSSPPAYSQSDVGNRVWKEFDDRLITGKVTNRLSAKERLSRVQVSDDELDDPRYDSKLKQKPVTIRLDPRPDPRYEHVYRQQEYEEKIGKTDDIALDKIHRNPNDLRHNLMKKHQDDSESSKFAAKGGRSPSRSRSRSKSAERSHRRIPLSRSRSRSRRRIRSRSRSRSRRRSYDKGPRQHTGDLLTKKRDELTWKQRMDLASAGHKEFAPKRGRGRPFRGRGFISRGAINTAQGHDNRDSVDYKPHISKGFTVRKRNEEFWSGRGYRNSSYRGGMSFRGRGRGFKPLGEKKPGFTSPSKGFPNKYTSPDLRGAWKHDMFAKLEKDEDQKPSSTTEK